MSYNGSGTFLINSAGQPVVANTVISATVFNALTSDLATGLSTAITKDGQTTITANIPFGSNKITGLGSGTAATDAANLGQVQSTAAKLITVTGTDTITGSMSPALTAYAAGQLFYFVSAGANTGPVTINIDSLGAKAITRDGATALANGDINSGEVVVVIYDGTRFQMINAANSFGNTTINGTLTVTGNTGLQANVSITSTLSVGGTFAVTGAATLGSTLAVTGKSDLPTVSTASINAAVALVTTGTVTNLTASGASIASANIGNLQFTAASIASINAGVAVITNLTATGASIASANVGTAVITTGTVTNLTSTSASVASINAAVALITTGTVTALTATGASVASANVGTAVVTGLTVTGASIASVNVGAAVLSGNLTLSAGTASGVLYLNGSKVATSGSALTFDGTSTVTLGGSGVNATLKHGATNGRLVLSGDSAVVAAITITGSTYATANAINYDGTTHMWSNTTGTGYMLLNSTGLGIGTASPTNRLTVTPASNDVEALRVNSLGGGGSVQGKVDLGFGFYDGVAQASAAVGFEEDGVASTGGILVFKTRPTGSAESTRPTTRLTLDASGNLGLGVTPSAWGTTGTVLKGFEIGRIGSGLATTVSNGNVSMMANAYYSGGWKYANDGTAGRFLTESSGAFSWGIAASGTAGNAITFTQAMTLDADGRLLIGTTTQLGKLTAASTGYSVLALQTTSSSSARGGAINFCNEGGSTDGQILYDTASDFMAFNTNGSERVRITSGGYFKASNDGTYNNATGTRHEITQTANDDGLEVRATNASYSANALIVLAARNTTNNSFYALSYYNTGASAFKFRVADSGDCTNTNGTYAAISDIKLKKDVVDAASQWDDIKNLRVRKYRLKSEPDKVQIGLVAQEAETVSPGLVDEHIDRDEDGNDLGTTTKSVKYSILYMKAVKALQEAMARIEQLEAKVAALEA